jgi:hypothetical protein
MRDPAGAACVQRGADELHAFHERFFFNGGGIVVEQCAVTDDGRTCALEYNMVAWGRTALSAEAGITGLHARRQRQARRRALIAHAS